MDVRDLFSKIDELKEDGTLRFSTEHAWSRPSEVEDVIQSVYPELSIFFMEEELGMEIFQTNDMYGEFFMETIILDDETEGMEYMTETGLLMKLSELRGAPIPDMEAAKAFITLYNQAQDTAGTERHLWLHVADIC